MNTSGILASVCRDLQTSFSPDSEGGGTTQPKDLVQSWNIASQMLPVVCGPPCLFTYFAPTIENGKTSTIAFQNAL